MSNRAPAPKPNRPRDPNAPAKPRRPRDELGRPLAYGATNRLQLEDYDALTIEENHRLGIEALDAERFFPAHEAWETCWKQAKGTPEAEFFKGLSQLGAGYTHHLRGNQHGAHTLLRRAAGRLQRYPSRHWGVDTEGLAATALAQAEAIEDAERAGLPSPALAYPKV